MKFSSIHLATCLLGTIWLLTSSGCGPSSPAPAGKVTKPEAEVTGALHHVQLQVLPTIAKVQGSLFVDESSTIAARVAGRVLEVNCDLGDSVDGGQLLIRIDPLEFQLRVTQMEAQLTQARAAIGLEPDKPISGLNPINAPPVRETRAIWDDAVKQVTRLTDLYKQGTVVAIDLEAAQSAEKVAEAKYNSALNSVREKIANVDVQSAQLDLAKQNLRETEVTSPFKATVQRRFVAPGTYVQAGQPLAELVRTDVLRFRAAVSERYAQLLAVGQIVRINLSSQQREAKVTRISPALDQVTRSLTFEAELENADQSLRGGLFASAEIVLSDKSEALAIPVSAVLRFAGTDKAWVVSNGKVKEAVLQLGRQIGDNVEILKGLQLGDQILLEAKNGGVGVYAAKTAQSDSQPSGENLQDSTAAIPPVSSK